MSSGGEAGRPRHQGALQRRYWALCANPATYRVEQAVRERETDPWTTGEREIRAGDWVVIWKSKGPDDRRGVVALGEVLTDPQPLPVDDNPYWVVPPPPGQVEPRVLVRYVRPPGLPLWEPDPALEPLSVSRARGGTVFHVTAEQWDALVERAGGGPVAGAPDRGPPAFVPRQRYRRATLHDRLGGQRQGGISTPAGWPVVLLFSSPRGADYGYTDGWTGEGLYLYTGEGQRGDMTLTRGNAALFGHADEGRDLHLFEAAGRGVVEYVGRMVCVGSEWREGPDVEGRTRKVLVFSLAPAEAFQGAAALPRSGATPEPELLPEGLDLSALRALALEPAASGSVPPAERVRRAWLRSQAVRRYALGRADGICEGCGRPAPFVTPAGGAVPGGAPPAPAIRRRLRPPGPRRRRLPQLPPALPPRGRRGRLQRRGGRPRAGEGGGARLCPGMTLGAESQARLLGASSTGEPAAHSPTRPCTT